MIEYIKLFVSQTPKILMGIALFCLFAIIAPNDLLQYLALLSVRDSVRQWLWIILLLSSCLLFSHAFFGLFPFFKGRLNGWVIVHRGKQKLKDLTTDEKEILRGYIEGNTMTQTFDCTNGAVLALESEHIIYRASEISMQFTDFPFNIQQWARRYLKRNLDLLSS